MDAEVQNRGLLNEMRAQWCWEKECRIFLSEMSCGEVVAGSPTISRKSV